VSLAWPETVEVTQASMPKDAIILFATGDCLKAPDKITHTYTYTQRVVFKFRVIWPTGNRWNRALFKWQKTTNFRLVVQLSLLRGLRPKSARASPRQCTQSAPGFFQIRSLSAFSYGPTREHHQNAPYNESNIWLKPIASRRITKSKNVSTLWTHLECTCSTREQFSSIRPR